MRIQHNIPAMNAYGNYNKNTKALQGNLQKLSSGYKINKAGDDAAGLAISEKMRAQITGLEVAQKNAKDGISLVQTAEGALTEVHTMLNRMYSLAEQSANGTYQNEVDRDQLQKEVVSLRDEIDRISKATNFNGQKLLDGTLAGTGGAAGATGDFSQVKGSMADGLVDINATKSKSDITLATLATTPGTWTDGTKLSFEIGTSDGKTTTINLTAKLDKDKNTNLIGDDGTTVYTIAKNGAAAATIASADLSKAIAKALEKTDIGEQCKIDGATTAGKLAFTAKKAGASTPIVTSVGYTLKDSSGTSKLDATKPSSIDATTKQGEDAYQVLDITKGKAFNGDATGDNSLENTAFEINGEKFVFIENGKVNDDTLAALREAGISHYVECAAAGDPDDGDDAVAMAEKIQMATGLKAEVGDGTTNAGEWSADATSGCIKLSVGSGSKGNGGLTLQIGDTSDDYNKMTVSIKNCNSASIGIGSVDIRKQSGASTAMTAIKSAINYVSDVRGTLGSLQNRLDHTINNLSVQQENIQDAEATIRDVDVANEMMAYTKNNILVQSAQAMLAQANQLPQGVLQLPG